MSAILQKIVAHTRERLRSEPPPSRQAARAASAANTPFAFSEALARPGVNVIAEIKAASPSAGTLVEHPDIDTIAAEYSWGGAAALSIVTEPEFFAGSRDWIARARSAASLPVIMKDFVLEESQILHGIACGANAVLLIASLLGAEEMRRFISLLDEHGCDALVEVHDWKQLEMAIDGGARLIGVNNRDLDTFDVDLGTSERLGPMIPEGIIRVAESGISGRDDIVRLRAAGFQGFLVGEWLLRQGDRVSALRWLRSEE